jgi:hypothetical protein
MSQALLAEGGRAKSSLAGPPDRLQGESEIGMYVGWATLTLAEQIPIHIADADPARSGPSVNAYEEGLRHQCRKVPQDR